MGSLLSSLLSSHLGSESFFERDDSAPSLRLGGGGGRLGVKAQRITSAPSREECASAHARADASLARGTVRAHLRVHVRAHSSAPRADPSQSQSRVSHGSESVTDPSQSRSRVSHNQARLAGGAHVSHLCTQKAADTDARVFPPPSLSPSLETEGAI